MELAGGAVNKVVRVGDTVRRAGSGFYGDPGFVQELLRHFERARWAGAPRYLGIDGQGRQMLSFVPGRQAVMTEESLLAAVRLLRECHDLAAGTPLAGDQEVVCHNDLSPANTVCGEDGAPVAFIDWDLAAPGRRVHDVAHLCWQWLDLGPGVEDVDLVRARIRLVAESYGVGGVVEAILWWQERCADGIEKAANAGDPAMRRLREAGTVEAVREARRWSMAHLV